MRYVSLSGGADSTAVCILLADRGVDFEMVFADTGAELPETYEVLPRIAKALNRKLHVVSTPGMFACLVRRRYFLPSVRLRWCTGDLKVKPLNKFYGSLGDLSCCIGIRADEEHRAKQPTNKPKNVTYEWPLVEAGLGKKEVRALCESRGLLNQCYQWRTNCSCFCCPFQRKADWLNLRDRHPDLFALAEQWEDLAMDYCLFTWSDGYTLQQLREADISQLAMFPEPREEACSICRW